MKSKSTSVILAIALMASIFLLYKKTNELDELKQKYETVIDFEVDMAYQATAFHCIEKAIFAYARNNKAIPDFETNVVEELSQYLPETDVFNFYEFPMKLSDDEDWETRILLTSAGRDKNFGTPDDLDYPIRKSEIEAWKLVAPYKFKDNYHRPAPVIYTNSPTNSSTLR